MASPSHVSGGVAPRKSLRVGHEVTTRNRARGSRLTRTQIAKLAKEGCDQLMCSVSSIYSSAELEGVQKEALEFEPDRLPRDDPQRPHPPEDQAPLEDFQRLRLLDGLDGVLNSGRGKINNWLDSLKTQERQEQLQEIDEWFVQFQDQAPELVSFFRNCETEVEQGRVLCQRSENLVNKLTQETAHTRQEVTEFVDHKLKPMAGLAGGGQGGMVHAIEKKRMIAQMNHDHARLGYETVEQQIQEVDAALEKEKQDFYDFRLSRMRMQQAEQDDIHELQNDIEKRQQALAKLNEEVEQKAEMTKNMESFVKFARRCTREGRRVESKDPELDQLATKYRDYALNRKRHIRTVVCKRIDDIERQEQEDRNAVSILRDWAREANLETKTKENVMEMVSAETKKRPAAVDSQEGEQNEGEIQTQARIKEELIQTLKNIRFEKGRIEDAIKHRKVIADAITQGEDARAEVRRQLRRGMVKTMHFLAEEEQEVRHTVGMPQLLPSTWQSQMQREWVTEAKPAAELYAHVLFASRLAGNAEETARTGRPGRSTENVERLKDLIRDAEALWEELRDLELKLTPAGVVEEADLLAEAGLEDLEEPWFSQERVNQHRLDDLRSLEQEMFQQARKVAGDLTAESCLLEGVNMAEILQIQTKNPKRLVRKTTSKKLL